MEHWLVCPRTVLDTVIVYYYRGSYILFFFFFFFNLSNKPFSTLFYRRWPWRSQTSKISFSTETRLVGSGTGIWIQNCVTPEYTLFKSPQLSFIQSEIVAGWAGAVLTASQGSAFSEKEPVTCSLQRSDSSRPPEYDGSSWLKPIYCLTPVSRGTDL